VKNDHPSTTESDRKLRIKTRGNGTFSTHTNKNNSTFPDKREKRGNHEEGKAKKAAVTTFEKEVLAQKTPVQQGHLKKMSTKSRKCNSKSESKKKIRSKQSKG